MSEVDSTVQLGMKLIILAVSVLLGFGIFTLAKSIAEEGISNAELAVKETQQKSETALDTEAIEDTGIARDIYTETRQIDKELEYTLVTNSGNSGIWNYLCIGLVITGIAIVIAVKKMNEEREVVPYLMPKPLKRSKDEITEDLLHFCLVHSKIDMSINKLVDAIYKQVGDREWYEGDAVEDIEELGKHIVAANIDNFTRNFDTIMATISKGKIKFTARVVNGYSQPIIKDKVAKRDIQVSWYYIILLAFCKNLDISEWATSTGLYNENALRCTAYKICKKVKEELDIYKSMSVRGTMKEAVEAFNTYYKYDMSVEFYKNVISIANALKGTAMEDSNEIVKLIDVTSTFKCSYLN